MITKDSKNLKGIVILLSFALTTAFFYNYFSPFGIPLQGQWDPSKGVIRALSKNHAANASMEIISCKTVQKIVEGKKWIIIDVRSRAVYDQGHLPGALSFPLTDFDEDIGRLMHSIDRQADVLVYCSSIECADSHTFADRLKNLKYDHVRVFSGGFRLWKEKGYKIQKNEE